jgi:deoxyribodipyrimidine photo-lyase
MRGVAADRDSGAGTAPQALRRNGAGSGLALVRRAVDGIAAVDLEDFEPTRQAAIERVQAARPSAYADSRNHLQGAVTRLSPYLTHGFVSLPEVITMLRERHAVGARHKLVFELAWREYFRDVWRHDGDAILESLHPGPLPDEAYARALPADVREARTGLAAIDRAVRDLYADGYLHNHARMWLASYLVHLRKVHWRTGADWMIAHLLDGDLASNHLSWQWVAGTGSHRPYLFNAENVLRYAPREWQVLGTALDRPYAELEAIARDADARLEACGAQVAVDEPVLACAPADPGMVELSRASADVVRGRDVWLVHPWCLTDPPEDCVAVAVFDAQFHARWPWSLRRWAFVQRRVGAIAAACWFDDSTAIVDALRSARSVRGVHDPHLGTAFDALALDAPPRAFHAPAERCRSFSTWWERARLRRALAARGAHAVRSEHAAPRPSA